MRKRWLNKNLLIPIAVDILAITIFAIGWIIMKNIHIAARENIGISIIFFITLLISMTAYFGIIFLTVLVIDVIDEIKKDK